MRFFYTKTLWDTNKKTPYRWELRLWRLAIYKYYRGDNDPDAHDHPGPFWTYPLQSYIESLYDPMVDKWTKNIVYAWELHHRPATYCHRVVGRWSGIKTSTGKHIPITDDIKPFWTIVWWGKRTREWGFYVKGIWIPWHEYIKGNRAWAEQDQKYDSLGTSSDDERMRSRD